MADARALLKAKRVERGAAGPKPRIAAVRSTAKNEEHLRKGKRKLESPITTMDARASSPAFAAPFVDAMTEPPNDKRRRIDEPMSTDSPPTAGFPADFFSDASRSLPIGDDDDGSENGHAEALNTTTSHNLPIPSHPSSSSNTTQLNPVPSSIDDEFAAFERAMQTAAQPPKRDAQHAAFAKATVAAEPELIADTATSGFPPAIDEESRRGELNNAVDAPTEVEETEIDQRRRKQEEERELIMDRLLDEERAQEEADAKVNALKARLEAIKLKRAAKKAGGQ